MRSVEQYINDVSKGLNLSADTRATIREELAAHIDDAVAAALQNGSAHETAMADAVRSLGEATELRSHYQCVYQKEHATRTLGRMLGLGAFAAILVATCAIGSTSSVFNAFWCSEAALFVLLAPLCLVLASHPMRDVYTSMTAPFRIAIDDRHLDYTTASAILRHWGFATVGCGAWMAVFGIILTCLRSSDLAAIGPALAFTILGLLYSLILAGILWTLAGSLPQTDHARTHTEMPSVLRRLIGITAFFGVVVLTARMLGLVSPEVAVLVDVNSVLFIAAGSAALLIATLGVHDAVSLLGLAAPADRRTEMLRTFGRYGLIVGIIGSLLGFVIVLATLNDPSRLMMSISVAMLTLLYGVTSWLLCLALTGPQTSHIKTDRSIEVGSLRPA